MGIKKHLEQMGGEDRPSKLADVVLPEQKKERIDVGLGTRKKIIADLKERIINEGVNSLTTPIDMESFVRLDPMGFNKLIEADGQLKKQKKLLLKILVNKIESNLNLFYESSELIRLKVLFPEEFKDYKDYSGYDDFNCNSFPLDKMNVRYFIIAVANYKLFSPSGFKRDVNLIEEFCKQGKQIMADLRANKNKDNIGMMAELAVALKVLFPDREFFNENDMNELVFAIEEKSKEGEGMVAAGWLKYLTLLNAKEIKVTEDRIDIIEENLEDFKDNTSDRPTRLAV